MKKPPAKKPALTPLPDDATSVIPMPEQVPINVEATNVVRMMLRDHVEKMEPGTKAIVAPNIQAVLNNVVVLAGPAK